MLLWIKIILIIIKRASNRRKVLLSALMRRVTAIYKIRKIYIKARRNLFLIFRLLWKNISFQNKRALANIMLKKNYLNNVLRN